MRKKNLYMVSIFVLTLLFFQSFIPLLAVTLPIGTTIQLEVSNTISSQNAYIGQKVNFKVLHDVSIDSKLVIEGGSKAVGKVVSVGKTGMLGKPGNLSIQLSRVTAIDGSNIPISASSVLKGEDKSSTAIIVTLILCVFGLFIKGGDAVLQAGSIIEADVISAVEIDTTSDTSNVINIPEQEKFPVADLKQGVLLKITIDDGEVIIGNLESKKDNEISIFNIDTLYEIRINRIILVIDNDDNDVTSELIGLEDFETITKYNWNSITVKKIY